MKDILLSRLSLLWALTKRDFSQKYVGSVLGGFWAIVTPIILLLAYTFVFSVVFRVRLGNEGGDQIDFAVFLFSGMIVYSLFADCMIRAVGIVRDNAVYIKKLAFPVGVLPLLAVSAALTSFVISYIIFLFALLFITKTISFGMMLSFVAVTPLVLYIAAFSFLFSGLGVYLRDLSQVIGVVLTLLLFLSPVFYPFEGTPEAFQAVAVFNPIAISITAFRDLALGARVDVWAPWFLHLVTSAVFLFVGRVLFVRIKGGFADVL